jgi:aminopeptidase N
VLWVTEASQDFTFVNIPEPPVPALLRGFSAPVKLRMDYNRDELMFLMSHDSDGFVRWEAGQQLALAVINEGLEAWRAQRQIHVDPRLVAAFRTILEASLKDPALDKAMVANLLLLPAEAYISELATIVEVDGIHYVREYVRKHLALELQESFEQVYRQNQSPAPYVYDANAVAARSLKNTSLNYLMLLEDPKWFAAARTQFMSANNMTDQGAALRAFVNNPSAGSNNIRDELLASFYTQWKHEVLVVEQWLALQCAAPVPDNLARVKGLIQHEAFDIRNPNKVRSVIGAFCNSNAVGFHALTGEGYEFLADYVIQLNTINPQIASRQLTPLSRWRKYSSGRQELMKAQLRRVMAVENLSKDVYEVVSKSLQE